MVDPRETERPRVPSNIAGVRTTTQFVIAPKDTVGVGIADLRLDGNTLDVPRINAAFADLEAQRISPGATVRVDFLGGVIFVSTPLEIPPKFRLYGNGTVLMLSPTFRGDEILRVPLGGEALIDGFEVLGILAVNGLSNEGIVTARDSIFTGCLNGVLNSGGIATVQKCTCSGGVNGISNTGGTLDAQYNTCENNSEYGIVLDEGRFDVVTNNRLTYNVLGNIFVGIGGSLVTPVIADNVSYLPASLTEIGLGGMVLDPVFNPDIHEYTTDTTTATATLRALSRYTEHEVVVYVNDVLHAIAEPITWVVGENEIVIQVGGQTAYYITVAYSLPLTLEGLTVGALELVPVFSTAVLEYAVTTANATNTITATPTALAQIVEVLVNDVAIENGTAATWLEGANTVTINVGPIGSQIAYTIAVTKTA